MYQSAEADYAILMLNPKSGAKRIPEIAAGNYYEMNFGLRY